MMVIYLDQLALVSFSLHYLLLLTAKHLIHAETGWKKLLLGAATATAYTLGAFLPHMSLLYTLPGRFFFSLLPSAIAFGVKNRRRLVIAAGVLFALTFAFGGAVYSLLSLMGGDGSLLWILAGATLAAYPILRIAGAAMEKAGKQTQSLCRVEVFQGEKQWIFNCLQDTGNSLKEPISGERVILVEKEQSKGLLPAAYRMVPFRSVGGQGLIPAFKPQKILIDGQECKNAYIGIWEGTLSPGGRYHGLC